MNSNIKKRLFSAAAAFVIFTQCVLAAPSPSPSPSVSPSPSPSVSPSPSPASASAPSASAKPKAEEPGNSEQDNKKEEFPEPHCEAAILTDRKTGEVLYSKNKDEKMYPASTTKIMTAVLALEKGNLADNVTVTQEAISTITNQHSHMGLKAGETFTLEQLLYGLLVYSANDAANVIGEHIAGSIDAFVAMMNDKAGELGLSGTHYVNTHGFHDDNHYTTAQDLATLTRYAMQNDKFCEIVKTGLYRIPANDIYTQERVLSSTNHLISRYRNTKYFYKYAVGVKTGHTDEAGSCLVSAATKKDAELIAVVLKADPSTDGTLYAFADSAKMFEYVFNNYKYCKIASEGEVVSDSAVYEAKNGTRVALSPKETIEKLLPSDVNTEEINAEITTIEKIKAPIAKGDTLGSVTYTYMGKELGKTDLVAGNAVERDYVLAVIHTIINIIKNPLFIIAAIVLIFLIISSNSRRKKRRQKRRSKMKYSNYK